MVIHRNLRLLSSPPPPPPPPPPTTTTWIDGESTFKSVPIRYVITALEDQFNIKIDSESIDDTTVFSGSFPHHNLNVALITVFDALEMKYNKKEKHNIKLRY